MRRPYIYIIPALLVSLFIYLFYRTEKTVVNEILISIISFDTYAAWKGSVVQAYPINNLIVYSLPEGLWVFCITLTSKPYFIKLSNHQVDCVYIPLLYAVGLEVLQLLHVTNGRFDMMDIGVSILAWLVGNFAFKDQLAKLPILAPLNFKTTVCVITYGIVYLSHVMK